MSSLDTRAQRTTPSSHRSVSLGAACVRCGASARWRECAAVGVRAAHGGRCGSRASGRGGPGRGGPRPHPRRAGARVRARCRRGPPHRRRGCHCRAQVRKRQAARQGACARAHSPCRAPFSAACAAAAACTRLPRPGCCAAPPRTNAYAPLSSCGLWCTWRARRRCAATLPPPRLPLARSVRRPAQGGFARCYAFTNVDKTKLVAGKVVDKMSLNKSKAKQKVRAGRGTCALAARARARACSSVPAATRRHRHGSRRRPARASSCGAAAR